MEFDKVSNRLDFENAKTAHLLTNLKHKLKDIHSGKTSHSLEDLTMAIDSYLETFYSALENFAIFPYIKHALALSEKLGRTAVSIEEFGDILRQIRTGEGPIKEFLERYVKVDATKPPEAVRILFFNLSGYRFSVEVAGRPSRVYETLGAINYKLDETMMILKNFADMDSAVSEHIRIEPGYHGNDEPDYKNTGVIVLSRRERNYVDHVAYSFNFQICRDCNQWHGDNLNVDELRDEPFNSKEEAVKFADRIVGRENVFVATNTEEYPLIETALPLAIKNHSKNFMLQHIN